MIKLLFQPYPCLNQNPVLVSLTFSQQALIFTCLQYKSIENTVEKGEIARNEQFLLFPQCFLPLWRTFFPFQSNLKLLTAISLILKESKICRLGKG